MTYSFTFYESQKSYLLFSALVSNLESVQLVDETKFPSSPYVPEELNPQTLVIIVVSASSSIIYKLRDIYDSLNFICYEN